MIRVPCPKCDGTGDLDGCALCENEGLVSQSAANAYRGKIEAHAEEDHSCAIADPDVALNAWALRTRSCPCCTIVRGFVQVCDECRKKMPPWSPGMKHQKRTAQGRMTRKGKALYDAFDAHAKATR